jgi:hypothetical protein
LIIGLGKWLKYERVRAQERKAKQEEAVFKDAKQQQSVKHLLKSETVSKSGQWRSYL